MQIQIKNDFIRIVILTIDGLYTQIYDEIYCDIDKYRKIQSKFGSSEKYKVIIIKLHTNFCFTYIEISVGEKQFLRLFVCL